MFAGMASAKNSPALIGCQRWPTPFRPMVPFWYREGGGWEWANEHRLRPCPASSRIRDPGPHVRDAAFQIVAGGHTCRPRQDLPVVADELCLIAVIAVLLDL